MRRRLKEVAPTAVLARSAVNPSTKKRRRSGLNLFELRRRAREYVELEASTHVLSVRFVERFRLFNREDVVLSVKTTDSKDPAWWVVGGSSPLNLYSRRIYRSADEVFSLHCGILLRLSDREFYESDKPPEVVGYDAFISHASEDKARFVRPLARALTRLGFRIWYDEFTLKIGDSLRRNIDQGLGTSRYGIVVLSKAFFAKQWPNYELDGLVARESAGRKVILPVWYGVRRADIEKFSPSLADKIAATGSPSRVAKVLTETLVIE